MSIAGGHHQALIAAKTHGCETVQLFTFQPRAWPVDVPLAGEAVRTFRLTLRRTGLRFPMAHASYLINLASPDEALYRRSIDSFTSEVQRADALGLKYLVMHPGSHVDSGEDMGLGRVATALDEVEERCSDCKVRILLETTAGQGTNLGHRFEHLARILELVRRPRRLGICLDTCHVFAAGYPLAPEKNYDETMRQFDHAIGLKKLCAIHVNDSARPQGSRVDRHAHIGQGHLGLEPFRLLVNDPRFHDLPMILETPKENDMDRVNLATLRGLCDKAD
jgi:deoxyribonuclease-4